MDNPPLTAKSPTSKEVGLMVIYLQVFSLGFAQLGDELPVQLR